MTDKQHYDKLWNESPMGQNGCCSSVLAVIVCIVLLFCSCATRKSIEYVDREVVKYQKDVVHDTLIQYTHDSVYHTVFQRGDTVYDTKYVEKTKWRDKIVYVKDTCCRDSIQIHTEEKTVEKQKIPKWCYVSLAVCVMFVIFAVTKLIRYTQWY